MEYANWRSITEELALSINNTIVMTYCMTNCFVWQNNLSYNVDTSNIKKIKDKVKCEKELFHKNKLDQILENLKAHRQISEKRCFEKYCSCEQACQVSAL